MAASDAVKAYLSSIGNAFHSRKNGEAGAQALVEAVRFDGANAMSYGVLRSTLQQQQSQQSDAQAHREKIVSQHARIPESERIHAFLVALLEYIEHNEPIASLTHGKGRNQAIAPSALLTAYASWAQVYSRASMVFQVQDTPYFGPTLRYVGTSLVLLAISADGRSGDRSQPSITDAVSRISRTTGVAAIDRSPLPGEQTKRSEVLWLANASFRCYFKLNNIRLCETVLGSVENALTLNRSFANAEQKQSANGDQATLGMACYRRADKVAYRYYLGRLRLTQHRIRLAYEELRWSFDNCTNAHMHNKNLILTHLIVSAIILGIYPKDALLRATNLEGPFGNLIRCIQMGDGHGMYAELDKWRSWHRHHGHYLLLKEKLEIGVWRNLMRRCFLIARLANGLGAVAAAAPSGNPSAPAPKTPPPVLKLAQFLVMARRAWQDDGLTMDDMECVVASLIDQGYVKAYAMHSSGNVVFRRTPDFGFVKMSSVY